MNDGTALFARSFCLPLWQLLNIFLFATLRVKLRADNINSICFQFSYVHNLFFPYVPKQVLLFK